MVIFPTVCSGLTFALTANMLINLKRRLKLSDTKNPARGVLESLTVVVPVRDEEAALPDFLQALLNQNTRPKELIFVDDCSADNTVPMIEEASSQEPWIRLLRGKPSPESWRGKVWALKQGLDSVSTEKVLFMDVDVRFESSDALGRLWSFAHSRSGFVSFFPEAKVSASASVLVHQVNTHLYYLMPFFSSMLPGSAATAGCGQLMFVDTKELKSLNAFEAIKESTHDGLKLARLYKKSGKEVAWADATGDYSCKFYADFKAAFRGFSRNSFEATESITGVAVICFVLFWTFVVPYVFFPLFMWNPFWAPTFLFFIYGQYRLAQEFNMGWVHLPLVPVKNGASIGVHLFGALRNKLNISSDWKGRAV